MSGLLWLGWLGCPKPVPVPPPPEPPPVEDGPKRTPIEGPYAWSEPGGLCLEVPEGWSGTTGPPPLVLDLVQQDSGFGLTIRTWAVDGPVPPREGFWVAFEDDGGYRAVPLLAPEAGTRTWQAEDPDGPTIQSWYGTIEDRSIEVSVAYPLGRAAEGRAAVASLLEAVCWQGASPSEEQGAPPSGG